MPFITTITSLLVIIYLLERAFPTKHSHSHLINLCESPIERRLYRALQNNNHYPVPQQKCGPYRIDLTLPYTTPKIAIECDGHKYHSTKQQLAKDRAKDDYLRSKGYLVRRYRGWQINRSMGWVLNDIEETVKTIRHQSK